MCSSSTLDALGSQRTVSAGIDLTLGLLPPPVGALVATGRLHGRRKAPASAVVPVPASPRVPADRQPGKPRKRKKDGWAQRLAEPRLGLALLIGAVVGIPGASYLTGLHILITSKSSTASQVVGVILFVVIEFLLILIPWASVELRPEATKAALTNARPAGPRPPAAGLHRPDPRRLPSRQRPSTPRLTLPVRPRQPRGRPHSSGPVAHPASLTGTAQQAPLRTGRSGHHRGACRHTCELRQIRQGVTLHQRIDHEP